MRAFPALCTAGLLAALLVPLGSSPGLAAEDPATAGRLVLLLDSSGSMAEPTSGGGTKIDAAKDAVADVADELPEGAEVGVRVFGATVENRSQRGACTDTQNVVPVGPVDRSAITRAVATYEPYGETPIGNALRGAARDLGPAQDGVRRTIVLLSDGEPTCAPDPCQVARQLRDRGIDLRINVVGLDVAGKARQALQCIARSGGGRYFDADNAEDLAESMVQVSVRGLREFSVSGTPVSGGTSTAAPTELEPGEYVDTTLADRAPKFYLVDVPAKGGVSASVVMRPERAGSLVDTGQVQLSTPDGVECASGLEQNINVLGLRSILGVSAAYLRATDTSASQPCAEARQLVVQVSFTGPPSEFSLHVRSYPEVTNPDALLEPADSVAEETWERPATLAGPGTPVIGGASFEDAPELTPGETYSDTLRPREQLIYKVPVEWGQSPRMTARIETDPTAARLQGILGVQAEARAFNALGTVLGATNNPTTGARSSARYNGDDPVTITSAQPPVRLRNLEQGTPSGIADNAFAGDYYFTVQLGGDPDRAAERFAAPIRISVAVDGEVEGVPSFAGEVTGESGDATPEATPGASDDEEAGGSAEETTVGLSVPTWVLAVGIGVMVAAVAAVAFTIGRRRR